jgi:cellulose synthase/poly-beta-1,6-N-acetylglucosamine synthase-like glycosyltransferase
MSVWVLALSLGLLVYTYAGYPLLVLAWARLAPQPTSRAPRTPRVAIVVVAFNEAKRIEAKLKTCLAQDYPADRLRVVIVCDGSTDATPALVASFGDARVRLVHCRERRGKSACLAEGVAAAAEADVIVFNDARQALHPQAVRRLVEALADPTVGAVSGELVFRTDDASDFGSGVDAYWRYEKFIRRHEAQVGSVVGVTGALYALRRELFRPIPAQTILDDVLIPMNVVMDGHRVVFESQAIAYDQPSLDAAQESLRKTRTLAGNFQLVALRPRLLVPFANPLWFQFVSHKLLRLVAPLAMGALLLSNSLLLDHGGLLQGLWVGQIVFYGAALTGWLLPAARRWFPVKLAMMFVVMNWFVVRGFVEFVGNRQAHLWRASATGSA